MLFFRLLTITISLGIAGSDFKQSLQFRNLNAEKENILLSVSLLATLIVSLFFISEWLALFMSLSLLELCVLLLSCTVCN